MTNTKTGDQSESKTRFEKFREFTRKVVSVPKSEIDRREREYKKMRKKQRRAVH